MNEREKAINLLLVAFPANESKQELRALLAAYDLALDGISDQNVSIAVRAFCQGRVDGHNRAFRPRPAELAAYARPLQEQDNRIAARCAEQRKQLAHQPFDHQHSAEERASHVQQALGRQPDRQPTIRQPEYRAADKRAKPWHDKSELAASMERIRAYEEAKGEPLPEAKL